LFFVWLRSFLQLDSPARFNAQLIVSIEVSIVGPPEARPADGLAVDFVVESDRAQLIEVVQRVRDGRLRTNIGTISGLDDAVAALNPSERIKGKTIIRVRP
jgi:NADPH:quinone reductase-like Zn-dependent oxidoreductase